MHLFPARPGLSVVRPVVARVAGLVLAAAAAGCSPPSAGDGGVSVEVTAGPRPLAAGPAVLEISVRDDRGRPLPAKEVSVLANMSHPGMVPVLASGRRVGPGEWRAELELTMAGDWFVEVEIRLEDGRSVSRTVEVPGVLSR